MQLFTTARKEFEAEFNFLEENTEKHKTYSVTKEVKGIDKKRDAIIRTISHISKLMPLISKYNLG